MRSVIDLFLGVAVSFPGSWYIWGKWQSPWLRVETKTFLFY